MLQSVGYPGPPFAEGQGSLRPEIQIETAVWPLRRPAIELPVISFIAEAFKRSAELPVIPCVSLTEIVAEKFVALTRRAGAELADAGGPRDPTLVRHVYDLHIIRAHYDLAEVALLAREIMLAGAVAYGHQFPAYRANLSPKRCGLLPGLFPIRALRAVMQVSSATWCMAKARILRQPSAR